MFKEMLEAVREKNPLIHCITNYVSMNDCANMLHAVGAAPIMAEEEAEVEEITAICGGLNINMGTLNQAKIPAMLKAGKKADELGHPVVLDPVGAGISKLRNDTAGSLLREVRFAAIRGNLSEIKALATGVGSSRGVDAEVPESDSLESTAEFAAKIAADLHTIVVLSGKTDIVTDGQQIFYVYNGNAMMNKVTGSGCQLSALITAFVTANPQQKLQAVLAAVGLMGVCGEKAFDRLSPLDGNASYRNYIIDAVYRMDAAELERTVRYQRIR